MSFLSIIHYIRHTTSCFMNLVSGKLFNASHGGSQNQAYSANSGRPKSGLEKQSHKRNCIFNTLAKAKYELVLFFSVNLSSLLKSTDE